MRLRDRLIALIALAALLALGACAAPAEPAVTQDAASSPASVVEPAAGAEQPAVVTPTGGFVAEAEPVVTATGLIGVPLEAVRDGDVVTVPLAAIEEAANGEFSVTLEDRLLGFVAYLLDGELFVRAAACPPCDSELYSLDGEELICEACATRFDARTGEGIDGACIDYPKAGVAYEVSGGLVSMTTADLVTAWDETLAPGSVPLEPNVIVAGESDEEEEEDSRPACCR